jgi:hypothetical protein
LKPFSPFPPRVFALIALAAIAGVFLGAREPLSWLVEHGYLRGRRAQGLQAMPLYLIPYFLLQLGTGLTFGQLSDRWKSLPAILKILIVLAFAGIAVAVVAGYMELSVENNIWVESGRTQ